MKPGSGSSQLGRRGFMVGAGIATAGSLAACASAANKGATGERADQINFVERPDTSTIQRRWASERLRGLMNLFLPSFHADLKTLDEDALRHDVNHAIAQGFSGTLPMINWTPMGSEAWERYHAVLVEEASGRLPIHGIAANKSVDDDIDAIRRLEELGIELVLMAAKHDVGISQDELHESLSRRCASTDLPIMLYAALGKGRNFPSMGPSGQPLEVFDRLADLPNVVAMKISQPVTMMSTLQLCDRVGDRLLMGPVNLDFLPLLGRRHHIQWSGQWNGEAIQTPSQQLGNQLIEACMTNDANAIATATLSIQPVLEQFFNLQADVIRKGAHPWQHNKYYSWLGGGNGGLLPHDAHAPKGAVPVLDAKARLAIRQAFAASGLDMTDAPEEQFVVGRSAWARGVRASDFGELPNYQA